MATSTYFLVLTNTGRDLIQAAYDAGTKVDLVEMAFGNSGGAYVEPSVEFTALVGEFGRNEITDGTSGGYLIDVQSYVDSTYAGETLREFGVYDADGNLIIYGSYPPSEIASADDPDYVQIIIEAKLELDNAESVTISVSPVFDYATEEKAGISRVASQTLVDEGADHTTFITPKTLSSKTIVRSDSTQTITGQKTFTTQLNFNSEKPSTGNQADIFHNGKTETEAHNLRSMRQNISATWIWEKIKGGNMYYSTGTDGSSPSNLRLYVQDGSFGATPAGGSWGHSAPAAFSVQGSNPSLAYNLLKLGDNGAKIMANGEGGAEFRIYPVGGDANYTKITTSGLMSYYAGSSQMKHTLYQANNEWVDQSFEFRAKYGSEGWDIYWDANDSAGGSRGLLFRPYSSGAYVKTVLTLPTLEDRNIVAERPIDIRGHACTALLGGQGSTPIMIERTDKGGVNCNIAYKVRGSDGTVVYTGYAGLSHSNGTNWSIGGGGGNLSGEWDVTVELNKGNLLARNDIVAFYGASKSVSTLEASLSRLDRMAPKPIERVTSYVAVEKLIEIVEMQQKQIDSLEEKVIALGGVDERKR